MYRLKFNSFLTALLLTCLFSTSFAQVADTLKPRKGSYLYWGQPLIEDNSMYIEEAFNQETGVIQHISNFIFQDGEFIYSYTQEIPLDDYRHQLSFTLPYAILNKPSEVISRGNDQYDNTGTGDLLINYRPLIFGKTDWAIVIPRFTLIVPTGSSHQNLGGGGWGGQFNLAVTKRLSKKLITHYNAGFTKFFNADYVGYDNNGVPNILLERDLLMKNVGFSAIWLVHPRFNLLAEFVQNYEKEILEDGSLGKRTAAVINPGFRFAFEIGKVQIVPGAGMTFVFENSSYATSGTFIYLSIEPGY